MSAFGGVKTQEFDMQYSGIVNRIGSKTFKNDDGEKVSHYFFLKGVERLFKMGSKRPTFKEGAEISFEANEKGTVEWNSIKPIGSVPAPTVAPASGVQALPTKEVAPVSSEATSGYSRFDKYRNREYCDLERRNINRQFAYRLAVELASDLREAGAMVLTNTKGVALSPDKAFDAYLAYVEELTNRIYNDVVIDHVAPPTITIYPDGGMLADE